MTRGKPNVLRALGLFLGGAFALVVSDVSAQQPPLSLYAIGNSLTVDAANSSVIVDLFAKGGVNIEMNYHIRCGSSLDGTLNNPDDACLLGPDGPWDVALSTGSYDILILQPHEGGPSTEAEIEAISHFAGLTDATVYVYEAYPGREAAADLQAFYSRPDQAMFQQSRAEFQSVRNAFPDAKVIPAMSVFLALDRMARAGQIPGMSTAQDLYRDSRHVNGIGQYALGLAFFSVITGLDPPLTGRTIHPNYSPLTLEQAEIIQTAVSDVVLSRRPLPPTQLTASP